MSTNMYRLSWVRVARIVLSISFVLGVTGALGACSSGITLFNNSGPAPYGQPGAMATGSIPAAMPMPRQPFVGNQLASAQAAAQQRPIYVYQPAPAQYPGQGYAQARYVAQPQYVAPPRRKAVRRKAAPVKKYTVARTAQQTRAPSRVARAPVPSAGMQKVRSQSNQQGRVVIVRSGETLYSIARRHRINIVHLKTANNIRGSSVRVGQKLFVPGAGSHHGARSAPVAPYRPALGRGGVTVARYQNGTQR